MKEIVASNVIHDGFDTITSAAERDIKLLNAQDWKAFIEDVDPAYWDYLLPLIDGLNLSSPNELKEEVINNVESYIPFKGWEFSASSNPKEKNLSMDKDLSDDSKEAIVDFLKSKGEFYQYTVHAKADGKEDDIDFLVFFKINNKYYSALGYSLANDTIFRLQEDAREKARNAMNGNSTLPIVNELPKVVYGSHDGDQTELTSVEVLSYDEKPGSGSRDAKIRLRVRGVTTQSKENYCAFSFKCYDQDGFLIRRETVLIPVNNGEPFNTEYDAYVSNGIRSITITNYHGD